MMRDNQLAAWAEEFEQELVGNILPFWLTHAVDKANSGFHGAVTNDLRVVTGVPRSSVMTARVLWTFAASYRALGESAYRAMADRALSDLEHAFWDETHLGVYWLVDQRGQPVSDRKHHYAQAFAIYGLSEHHRATGAPHSLELAQAIFEQLEAHACDRIHGGYTEGSTRAWEPQKGARLSDRDLDAPKSMNTMLHLMEAYTNLHRVWQDERVRTSLQSLMEIFCTRILDASTGHLRLFFDEQWTALQPGISFGHDIEASWLLCEAAAQIEDAGTGELATRSALRLGDAALRDGLDEDGSLFSERAADGRLDRGKDWWPQTEAIVGFYNAYQLTGEARYAEASQRCWQYVQQAFVDREYGGWYKRLDENGVADPQRYKLGPWECPYHHSRACLEMMERLRRTDSEVG